MLFRSRRELDEVVAEWTSSRDGQEAMEELQAAGVAAYVVQNSAETISDPQLAHRGNYVEVPHDAMGSTWIESNRLHLSRTPAQVRQGAPTLGQHTWEVLTEVLAYDPDRAAELIGTGIFE